MEKEGKNIKVRGRSDFIMKEKLRLMKSSLFKWDMEFYDRIDLDMEEGIGVINDADLLLESCKGSMIK